MGRYYGSEALRNKTLQRRAINYGLKKLTPMIEEAGGKGLDQMSTKIRPNKRYKTDRKHLDVGNISIQDVTNKLSDILTDPQKIFKKIST